MERDVYERMSAEEAKHWWFVGRRANLETLLNENFALDDSSKILEAGCGTGGNLALLDQFGSLEAFEYDETARALSEAKGIAKISHGALPSGIDYPDQYFDLIAMLDVLEHVEEDTASLRTLGSKLSDSGQMLITVPAMPWLWSEHDEVHHHYRRYTKSSLEAVIGDAGLRPLKVRYFNSLLFPLAVAQRLASKAFGRKGKAEAMPAKPVNAILSRVFGFERHFISKLPMPFGLSLYAIVGRS